MQTRKPIASIRAARPGLAACLLAAAALGMSGCGFQSWQLTRDPGLTGSAAGYVALGKPGHQGRPIEVRVYHVEEPASLATGARCYVVWLSRAEDERPQKLGVLALRLSGDGQSSNGLLRANTPYDEFRIFVTPEESVHIEAPQNPRAFWVSIGPR